MNYRRSLSIAYGFVQGVILLVAIFFCSFLYVILISLWAPESFPSLVVHDPFNAGYGIAKVKICSDCTSQVWIPLPKISDTMKVWVLIRGSIFFILTLVMLHFVKKIIKSIKNISTFYNGNIGYFKNISRVALMIAMVSSFNINFRGDGTDFYFTIPFGPLGISLACWILTKIFQEGKILVEDRNSII